MTWIGVAAMRVLVSLVNSLMMFDLVGRAHPTWLLQAAKALALCIKGARVNASNLSSNPLIIVKIFNT